jgi:MFS family permease
MVVTATRPGARDPRNGWTIVAALAVTETVSWGVLYYAFAVFLPSMQHSLSWSKTELTGAFSAALATSALAAFPVGRWLDRHSPRPLMTLGSLAGALLVLAWSQVHDLLVFYLVWVGIGLAMACVLYEAAFTVITKWFRERRRQALMAVTLVGGWASFVFSPLSNWLIDAQGWREALITLAIILATATVPLHAVFLRLAPERDGEAAPALVPGDLPAARGEPAVDPKSAVASSAFWYLTAAFVLSSFVISAVAVHLIAYLLEGGRSAAFAALAAGLMGLMQVPGRLLLAGAATLLPRHYEAPAVFLLQGAGLAVLAATTTVPGVLVAVCLFGMGNGMATLVRATAIAEAYGATFYGSIAGVVAACATGARAIAPVAAAGAYVAFSGYKPLLWLMVAGAVLAAVSAGQANRELAPAPPPAVRNPTGSPSRSTRSGHPRP